MTDEQWALGDYVHEPCPNCGRARLCECDNGKHRCEKCNWSPELNDYVVVVDPLGEYSDLFGEDNQVWGSVRLGEKISPSYSATSLTTADALTAALDRIEQLEQVLLKHIRIYRVDDQHPDPDAEAHRLMQKELHGYPKMTTENAQS